MENYEVTIKLNDSKQPDSEIIMAFLNAEGFDGFIEESDSIRAYIDKSCITEPEIDAVFSSSPLLQSLRYTIRTLENKNWNEEWEKNFFKTIRVGDKCLILSSFHLNEAPADYEILIDPKMSFGTGHHSTTHLMISELLDTEVQNKAMLDMGCGTGILAILAAKMGCQHIEAIDIDEWAYNNTLENIGINNVSGISVFKGGAELLTKQQFDLILANINRNILLDDMQKYAGVFIKGGMIYFSGFYLSDLASIIAEASQHNLQYKHHRVMNEWTMAVFEKRRGE